MARKLTPTSPPTRTGPQQPPAGNKPVASTPVRNSPIPKASPPIGAPAASKPITHEMIAARAYEISRSASCGSDFDNWVRAERELRGV